MLTLKDIKKTYTVGEIETTALKGISTSFRNKEFVAILGKSGSGKTTVLNIIGGLDRYDSGDLIIKGRHTKDFQDKDWDAYRNNSIGFVFQSYNLINHLNIVDNVELGMTLSGVDSATKRRRAIEVLEQVGLKDHLHKKPNQLSGGQQQRVAIARALSNDPEILLCDEPTGALDTETSKQILDLIKSIASDRLVVMVTHNPELAHEYADRILEFEDGLIKSDSNPYNNDKETLTFDLKHTKMSFFTALKLSFNNIRTKIGRTLLTSFASSIGIIGIAVILSLSTGFQEKIDEYQRDALSEFPIIISPIVTNLDPSALGQLGKEPAFPDDDFVFPYDPNENLLTHQNIFTGEFLDHIKNIDPNISSSVGYSYMVKLNLVRNIGNDYKVVEFGSSGSIGTIPVSLNGGVNPVLQNSYDFLAGSIPQSKYDLVLVVNNKNQVDQSILRNLGFDIDVEKISFDDIVGTEFKWIPNDVQYVKNNDGSYSRVTDLESIYNSEESVTLKISGVARIKEGKDLELFSQGLLYSDEFVQDVIANSMASNVVIDQKNSDVSLLVEYPTTIGIDNIIKMLGGSDIPLLITVYPIDFSTKEEVVNYINRYNEGKEEKDVIIITDLSETIAGLTGGIMDGITIVLIAFAGISLVVSLIMIGIITYTSVLERTKEIGILKALGARKKDITRVFDAETFILGVFSGTLGITIAYLLTIPINMILYKLTDLKGVANLQIGHAVTLVIISTLLTVIGGHIPAKMASKKDAVTALRSE